MLRREFLKNLALSAPLFSCMNFVKNNDLFFDIGLAQWSFNGALKSGVMNNLDFALVAKEKFNITTVEYVNQFFFDKANKNFLSTRNVTLKTTITIIISDAIMDHTKTDATPINCTLN